MHSIHAILVNIPYAADDAEKNLSEMTKEEIKEMVISYATEETERFYGTVFDSRELLDEEDCEEDNDECYLPVVLASEDWEGFEKILLDKDRCQKHEASWMLACLKKETGSTDVSAILKNLLLVNDRTANRDNVNPITWDYDSLNQGAWLLREIANLIHGDYTFDSCFYDTSRDTALVPFIAQLKENPADWALVQFDYHC